MLHSSISPHDDFCAVLQSGCPIVQMGRATMRMVLTALTVASMIGGLVSCAEKSSGEKPVPAARGSQTSTQVFSVKGVVKELKPDGRTIVIKHEEIPNYMAAMTMPFEARNTNDLAGLKPGEFVGVPRLERHGHRRHIIRDLLVLDDDRPAVRLQFLDHALDGENLCASL